MWRNIINECKRKRDESLVYIPGSQQLKEAQTFFTKCIDQFSIDSAGNITTPVFKLHDIPHWEEIDQDNKTIEWKSLSSMLQEMNPKIDINDDFGEQFWLSIPSEEEADAEISGLQKIIAKAQDDIAKAEKELEKWKKLKE